MALLKSVDGSRNAENLPNESRQTRNGNRSPLIKGETAGKTIAKPRGVSRRNFTESHRSRRASSAEGVPGTERDGAPQVGPAVGGTAGARAGVCRGGRASDGSAVAEARRPSRSGRARRDRFPFFSSTSPATHQAAPHVRHQPDGFLGMAPGLGRARPEASSSCARRVRIAALRVPAASPRSRIAASSAASPSRDGDLGQAEPGLRVPRIERERRLPLGPRLVVAPRRGVDSGRVRMQEVELRVQGDRRPGASRAPSSGRPAAICGLGRGAPGTERCRGFSGRARCELSDAPRRHRRRASGPWRGRTPRAGRFRPWDRCRRPGRGARAGEVAEPAGATPRARPRRRAAGAGAALALVLDDDPACSAARLVPPRTEEVARLARVVREVVELRPGRDDEPAPPVGGRRAAGSIRRRVSGSSVSL